MIQKLLFPIFLALTLNAFTQTRVEGTSYTQFQVKLKKDTIDFVIADTNLNVAKPLLLFCQGSLPVPLFIEVSENRIWPVSLSNFDLEKMNESYHVAVISMPKTPLIVGEKNLNSQSSYVTDTTNNYSFSPDYLEANYLENYVNRANKVLKFLKKQKWIESGKIVVAGHSQGARVATKIASKNRTVTQLGLFGGDPFGRIDQMIRQARYNAHLGRTTWEEADAAIKKYYEIYKDANNPDLAEKDPSLKTLKSFSEAFYVDLLKLKIPIYVAYGTEDRGADLCDLLPLYFIEQGKENLTLKRYLGLEHNFFEVDENGRANYELAHWEDVMNQFVDWTK